MRLPATAPAKLGEVGPLVVEDEGNNEPVGGEGAEGDAGVSTKST